MQSVFCCKHFPQSCYLPIIPGIHSSHDFYVSWQTSNVFSWRARWVWLLHRVPLAMEPNPQGAHLSSSSLLPLHPQKLAKLGPFLPPPPTPSSENLLLQSSASTLDDGASRLYPGKPSRYAAFGTTPRDLHLLPRHSRRSSKRWDVCWTPLIPRGICLVYSYRGIPQSRCPARTRPQPHRVLCKSCWSLSMGWSCFCRGQWLLQKNNPDLIFFHVHLLEVFLCFQNIFMYFYITHTQKGPWREKPCPSCASCGAQCSALVIDDSGVLVLWNWDHVSWFVS